jgi:hypothetical protein
MPQLPVFVHGFTANFELGKHYIKFDVSKATEDWIVILWNTTPARLHSDQITSQSKLGKQLDLQFSQL